MVGLQNPVDFTEDLCEKVLIGLDILALRRTDDDLIFAVSHLPQPEFIDLIDLRIGDEIPERRVRKDEIDTVLEILLLLYRDALVYIKTGSRRYVIQQDKIDDIINMAQTSNTAQLEKRCDAINDTRMKLLNNGDFQLMTETLFFKIKEK